MIVNFTVKNYLSIKEEATLSFLANPKKDNGEYKLISVEDGKYMLYPFAAIYGANASGKSNVIKAMMALKSLIIESQRLNLDDPIKQYEPFKLDKANINLPVEFSIEFITGDVRYIYEVKFVEDRIIEENLFFFPDGHKAFLFKRDQKMNVKYGVRFKGEKKALETLLLDNKLFLPIVANSKNEMLNEVFRFFSREFFVHSQMDSSNKPLSSTTELLKKDEKFKKQLLGFLKAADLGISDVKVDKVDKDGDFPLPKNIPDELKDLLRDNINSQPYLGHTVYNNGIATEEVAFFDLEREESKGTLKMYELASEVLVTLMRGTTLVVDEFNSGLHTGLNTFLMNLFLDPNINKECAQLLVATHDVCVLDLKILKREQVWFTDKSKEGATELYSLDEFDKNAVRDGGKFSKFYLDGRFDAVPKIDYKELTK